MTDTAAQVGSETAASDRARSRKRAPGEPRNVAWLYILPGLLFYGLFTLAPLAHTVELSFFDWDGLTVGHYIGLGQLPRGILRPAGAGLVQALGRADRLLRAPAGGARPPPHRHPDPPPGARLHVLPHRPLPAADDRGRGRGAGVGVDLRRQRAAQRIPARHRPGRAGAAVAGRLHLGPARGGRDRDVGDLRPLHGALHRRRPEHPVEPLRRSPRRRRRRRARVLRRYAAGAPKPGRRRVRPDHDQRPAQLRHHLQHDQRWPRHDDVRAVVLHVPERVRVQPGRLRGRNRRHPHRRDLHARGDRALRQLAGEEA